MTRIFLFFLIGVLFACEVDAADAGVSASIGSPSSAQASSPGPVTSGSNVGSLGSGVSVSASAEAVAAEITDPGVIARIGGVDVKLEEMRKIIESLEPSEQAAVAADPNALLVAVRAILVERVILKEVSEKHWDQRPEVAAHLDRIRQSTLAKMYLQAVSTPAADYPGEAELQSAYEANKASLTVPHQFRIAQILIMNPSTADKAAAEKVRKKLETVTEELSHPDADFAKIARLESDEAASAAQGGEMGWIVDNRMPPRIRLQAMTLAKNAVSTPIQTTEGWHFIKVLDSKDPRPLSFEEVKEKLKEQLRAQRAEANRQAYIARLMNGTAVSINNQALPKVMNTATN